MELQKAFSQMGARVKLVPPRNRFFTGNFSLNIRKDNKGEFFEVTQAPGAPLTMEVVDVQKDARHLLLMVRQPSFRPGLPDEKEKFLCGHDERQWFVAAVPNGSVSSVRTAMEALKPRLVQEAQARAGVKFKHRNRRRNSGFIRQGEWFFLPEPSFTPDPKLILTNEPLIRGRTGKPHTAQFLFRSGGEAVWVNHRFPNGLTQTQYAALLRRDSSAKNLPFTQRRRNMGVFVRGTIRHPDHATIQLGVWHRVVPNTETEAPSMRSVAFID